MPKTAYAAQPLANGLIRVAKVSRLSGKTQSMDLPVTLRELDRHFAGEHAQDVWPSLSAEQREFLISGITPAEWNATFNGEDE